MTRGIGEKNANGPEETMACYQCGWLGMCVVSCPLADPARMISPTMSSIAGLDSSLDDVQFEIVLEHAPKDDSKENGADS